MSESIDLGHDHTLEFTSWKPDRAIPQNAERFAGVPDVERYGAVIRHPGKGDGRPCVAAVTFAGLVQQQVEPGRSSVWTVESWEPLTLSPSLLCHCGDHAFVRDGKWVPA